MTVAPLGYPSEDCYTSRVQIVDDLDAEPMLLQRNRRVGERLVVGEGREGLGDRSEVRGRHRARYDGRIASAKPMILDAKPLRHAAWPSATCSRTDPAVDVAH
jgi:hypothetical protein